MRKLCQLLAATYYYEMETYSQSIFFGIQSGMKSSPSLACVVIDEFGLDIGVELRPLIASLIGDAVQLIEGRPHDVLLSSKNEDDRCGVCFVQHPGGLQEILTKVNAIQTGGVWLEYKILYIWSSTSDSNRVVAAEIWEERNVLARLQEDDPNYFANLDVVAFGTDAFGTSELFLNLYNHIPVKENMERESEGGDVPYVDNMEGEYVQNTNPADESLANCGKCLLVLLAIFLAIFCLGFILDSSLSNRN